MGALNQQGYAKDLEIINKHKAIWLDSNEKAIHKTMDILRSVKMDHHEKGRLALKIRQKKHEKVKKKLFFNFVVIFLTIF